MSDVALAASRDRCPDPPHRRTFCARWPKRPESPCCRGHVTKDGELADREPSSTWSIPSFESRAIATVSLRLIRALSTVSGRRARSDSWRWCPTVLREMPDATILRGPDLNVPGVVFTVTNDGSRRSHRDASVGGDEFRFAASGRPSSVVPAPGPVARGAGIALRRRHQRSRRLRGNRRRTTGNEPGVDVALALAVASAALNFAVPRTLATMGRWVSPVNCAP